MDFDNVLNFSGFLKKELEKEKEKEINYNEKEIEMGSPIVNSINPEIFEIRKEIKSAHGKRIKPGMTIDSNKEIGVNTPKNIPNAHLDHQTFILDDTEKTINFENNFGFITKKKLY